jgi:hypothetical protein
MQSATGRRDITVILFGELGSADISGLQAQAETEVIAAPLPPDAPLIESRAIVNPIVDEARADWILLLRGGEVVTPALAAEIIAATAEPSRAWGYRLPREALYCGVPLPSRSDRVGEIRLFHRRHARLVENPGSRELKVQGSVIRLEGSLRAVLYDSVAAHRKALAESGRRRKGAFARIALFLRCALRDNSIFSAAALRYAWQESAYESATSLPSTASRLPGDVP